MLELFHDFLQGPQEHNSVAGSDGGESSRGSGRSNHRDINKNLMNVAELKKLNTRFYSEVLRKKFFVLYEDSRQSLTNPRDHHSDVSFNLKAFRIAYISEPFRRRMKTTNPPD